MTDFLTRLAKRTLGLAPIVQPQIASRYAPATEVIMAHDNDLSPLSNVEPASKSSRVSELPLKTPAPFATTHPSEEELNVSVLQPLKSGEPEPPLTQLEEVILPLEPPFTSFSNSTEKSVSKERSDSILGPLKVSRNNPENPPSPSQLPFSPIRNSSENFVNSFPRLPRQKPENQAVSFTDESVEPQQLSSSSIFREPSSPLSPQSLQQSEQKPHTHSINLPLVPSANANSSVFPLVDTQDVDLESSLIDQQNRISSGLASTQYSPVHLSSPLAQPAERPEPTIEIKINRIEVRGIQPKVHKPHRKSAPSTPALSLSDYLSRRGGGKQ